MRLLVAEGWVFVTAWTASARVVILTPRRFSAHDRIVEPTLFHDRRASGGWLQHTVLGLDHPCLVPKEHGIMLCLERRHIDR